MEALTRSGVGRVVARDELPDDELVPRLEELLGRHGFLVIPDAAADGAGAVALMRRLGPLNEASTRTDSAVVVEARDDDEVFRSNAALPLHVDGVLTGFDVVTVGIFCLTARDVVGGRTLVSDARDALEAVPSEHLAALRERGFEVLALDDTGYYRSEYARGWSPFPAFRTRPGREPSLCIGLPHEPGEPASWRLRVPGLPPEESDAVFRSLRDALHDPSRLYAHTWREGDLLLMDNDAVMHGREAFSATSRRLANIQVLAG